MADNPPAKSTGGKRVKGELNENQRKQRESCLRTIKAVWKISEFGDAFPLGTEPHDPGQSTLINLRTIANKVNDLRSAKLLFTNECKDAGGHPIRLSFSHSRNIVEALKRSEDETRKQESSPRARARTVPPKTSISLTAPKVPDLIAPSPNVKAPYSVGRGMNSGNTSITAPAGELREPPSTSIIRKRERQPERLGESDNLESALKKVKAGALMESVPKMESKIDCDDESPMLAGDTNKPLNCNFKDEMDDLDRLMVEHKRANDEFFGRSMAASRGVPEDTIVVDAHLHQPHKQHQPAPPCKPSKPASKLQTQPNLFERMDGGVSAAPVAKMTTETRAPRDALKEQCLMAPQAVRQLLNTYNLHILARKDQQLVVQRVKDVFDRTFAQMETDLRGIFDGADIKTLASGHLQGESSL